MLTTITIMHVGKPDETREVDLPREPGFDTLKPLILPLLPGADHFEHVSVQHDGKRADMFVDDEGVAKELPCNAAATKIYRAWWLSQHPKVRPESLPAIYGPVVLFNRIVWF